jgi:tRNA A37 threonylcarbamoyladenosine synthetase subunit TsaC/SUA5/YrdC
MDAGEGHPPLASVGDTAAAAALGAGLVIAVPAVGGYCLAMRAGPPEVEARLEKLAADPDGPHYAVGYAEALHALTSGWNDELRQLLDRCWPGPVEVFVPRGPAKEDAGGAHAARSEGPAGAASGGWAIVVGMPEGRALRRLCREKGPWRTVPLGFTDAREVAQAFDAADVALVVDGGRREGPPPTLVDATVSPIRVLREGALPANFIEGTMLMSKKRRWLRRSKRSGPGRGSGGTSS